MVGQPKPTETTSHVFFYAALDDKHTTTLYTYAADTFPYQSLYGNQATLVANDYTSNAILVESFKNSRSGTMSTKMLENDVSRPHLMFWTIRLAKL